MAGDSLKLSWGLTQHVCRVCLGRVIVRKHIDGKRRYRCTNCGLEQEGTRASVLCCCGIKLRGGKDAGLRCMPNPDPRPECPAEIVVEAAEAPGVTPASTGEDELGESDV